MIFKKLLVVLSIVIFAAIGGVFFLYSEEIIGLWQQWNSFSFCEEPIPYKIGTVDEQFGISRSEFESYTQEAVKIWNSAYGKDLFVQNPDASLSVNLLFDDRQNYVSEINSGIDNIDSKEQTLNIKMEEYDRKLQNLDAEIKELNKQIEYWNGQGGAPEDVYDDLVSNQRRVQKEIDVINQEAALLNKQAEEYNASVENVNSTINQFNSLLSTKPEEGIYNPATNRIEIYLFDTPEEFTHTIAHEFGHALGIEHVEDNTAIMHPIVNDANVLSPKDLEELTTICREQNRTKLFIRDLKSIINITLNREGVY